jgi:hypothetical protein
MIGLVATLMLAAATALPSTAIVAGADIVNSGSTNTVGYMIHVNRSGSVVVDLQNGGPPRKTTVPPELAGRFFAALEAAEPLGSAPIGKCMKSASFGYSLRVRYGGEITPDLTCPASDPERTLASLTSEIERAANVANTIGRRRPSTP